MTFKEKMANRHGSFGLFLFAALVRGMQIIAGFIVFGLFLADFRRTTPSNAYPTSGMYGIFLGGISVVAALVMLAFAKFWPVDFVFMIAYAVLLGIYGVKTMHGSGDQSVTAGIVTATWTSCAALGLWGFMFLVLLIRWRRARKHLQMGESEA